MYFIKIVGLFFEYIKYSICFLLFFHAAGFSEAVKSVVAENDCREIFSVVYALSIMFTFPFAISARSFGFPLR